MTNELKALNKAVELVGGQAALARKIGKHVKQAHVWNWLHRGNKVPAEHVLSIEQATSGEVTRHELRPDVFGEPK